MHQMVGNILRTLLHGEPPQDMASAKEYIEALSIAMHATSEVQNKMIFIGHPKLSCHAPVVRSFFIYFKIIASS
jgi:hypothetical protein